MKKLLLLLCMLDRHDWRERPIRLVKLGHQHVRLIRVCSRCGQVVKRP